MKWVKWIVLSVVALLLTRHWLIDQQVRSSAPGGQHKVLIVYECGVGEEEWAGQLLKGAPAAGIEAKWVKTRYPSKFRWLCRRLIGEGLAQQIADQFQPDAVILLQPPCPVVKGYPNYQMLSTHEEYFLDSPRWDMEKLAEVSGVLYAAEDLPLTRNWCSERGIRYNAFHWPPSAAACAYQERPLRSLFYCGGNWDQRRRGETFVKLFKRLDQTDWIEVYGPKRRWRHMRRRYFGQIPYDGTSLAHTMQNAGIALAFHSQGHLDSGAPTARVVEAAANSCVIISDLHPWVEEEFGDSVLYVTAPEDADALFEEIREKVEWIKAHQDEAHQMAQKANEIFNERFSSEQQWKRFWAFHQRSQQ